MRRLPGLRLVVLLLCTTAAFAAERGELVTVTFEIVDNEFGAISARVGMAFDPDVIVLGGGVSGAGDFLRDLCMQELRHQFAATHDPLYCDVKIAHHQNDAGILGAALLAKLRHEK